MKAGTARRSLSRVGGDQRGLLEEPLRASVRSRLFVWTNLVSKPQLCCKPESAFSFCS